MSCNYADWVKRLDMFVSRLRRLPGRLRLKCEIGPAVDRRSVLSRAQSLNRQLPDALVRFYAEGTGKCTCTYWWDVPEPSLKLWREIFPAEHVVMGGLELCGIDEIEDNLQRCLDTAEALESNKIYEDAKMWSNAVPFHPTFRTCPVHFSRICPAALVTPWR